MFHSQQYIINAANYKLEVGMKVRYVGTSKSDGFLSPIEPGCVGTIRAINSTSQNPEDRSIIYQEVWFDEWDGFAHGRFLVPVEDRKKKVLGLSDADIHEKLVELNHSINFVPVLILWESNPLKPVFGIISRSHKHKIYELNGEFITEIGNYRVVEVLPFDFRCQSYRAFTQITINDLIKIKGDARLYTVVEKHLQTPTSRLSITVKDNTGVTTRFAMVEFEIEKAYTPILL